MHKETENVSKIANETKLFCNSLYNSFCKYRYTVLYGLRRSGKTFFLKNIFVPFLKGAFESPVLFVDLEEIFRLGIQTDSEFMDFFNSKIGNFKFVIFDEISILQNFPLF